MYPAYKPWGGHVCRTLPQIHCMLLKCWTSHKQQTLHYITWVVKTLNANDSVILLYFQVMILITGAHKAFALYKAIEEGVNHMWTVSAFQQHPRTIFVCDEDATLELRVKTVKYFKGMWTFFCFINTQLIIAGSGQTDSKTVFILKPLEY